MACMDIAILIKCFINYLKWRFNIEINLPTFNIKQVHIK